MKHSPNKECFCYSIIEYVILLYSRTLLEGIGNVSGIRKETKLYENSLHERK